MISFSNSATVALYLIRSVIYISTVPIMFLCGGAPHPSFDGVGCGDGKNGSTPPRTRFWPTSSLASGYGKPLMDSISTTTNDCPKHFSNSVRVCRSHSSRVSGGIPINFTVSPGFMSVFYGASGMVGAIRPFHSLTPVNE
jgi:hypothetical protein